MIHGDPTYGVVMEPVCSVTDLARLAEECRAEGLAAEVEEGALRVCLPGACSARPDAEGRILGWTESDSVLWYGRFDNVAQLIHSVRGVRHVRWLAKTGLGLIGLWLLHVTVWITVPGYKALGEDAPFVNGILFLGSLLGLVLWLVARLIRWRLLRTARGVVWLRGPLEARQSVSSPRIDRTPRS